VELATRRTAGCRQQIVPAAVTKIGEAKRRRKEGAMSKSAQFLTDPKERADTASLESMPDILERRYQVEIVNWLVGIERARQRERQLARIPLHFAHRAGHAPHAEATL
jgi:hypothetical protein